MMLFNFLAEILAGPQTAEQLAADGYLKAQPALPGASSSKHTLDDLLPSESNICSTNHQSKCPRLS